MRISITIKVFFTLLLASSVVVAGMYLFMQWSFKQGFIHLVEARKQQYIESLSQRLVAEYRDAQGWERLRDNKQEWVRLIRGVVFELGHPPVPRTEAKGVKGAFGFNSDTLGHDLHRPPSRRPKVPHMLLLDVDRALIAGRVHDSKGLDFHTLVLNGQTIGYLGMPPGPFAKEMAEIRFEQQHGRSLIYIAIGMLILSAVMGLPLAYTMVRPLRRITEATKQLAMGRYATRLHAESSDEIGQLAQDINELAYALAQTEKSRRQWVADISHELRTPLSVLRGEVEALQDGMRQLSGEALDSLHGEILRLNRLVDELYQLSLSDVGALHYHKQRIDAIALLRENVQTLEHEFRLKAIGIKLDDRVGKEVFVHADDERLSQLFRNLLMNSLNYTDPGGRVEVLIDVEQGRLIIDLQDSAPGVPDEALPQLFERLYRVDPSRSRQTGGAGLGLAICRNIVEAHAGRISARHSPLGGLWIRVELPVIQ